MSQDNCKETLAKVFEFLGNDLDGSQKRQVEEHLGECPDCKKEFVIESRISNLISSSSLDAQSSFASKVQNRLQSEL